MHNEKAEDFITMANEDLSALEQFRYFDFTSANSACFHAQQYAEKMIKARLLQMNISLIRSHDLLMLLDYFDDSDEIERAKEYCTVLAEYEAKTRYPYDGVNSFTPEDAEHAYELAIEIPYLIGIYEKPKTDSEEPVASQNRKAKKGRKKIRWFMRLRIR